jgi:uncharacterized membrane protein
VVVRLALAVFMVVAGTGHLVASDAFLGQTPTWLPWRTPIIWASGVIEIGLGSGLALTSGERRRRVGWALAIFYVVIFPGNVYQAVAGTDAFGLDTAAARWARLLFQPVLIFAALWSSGAWPRRSPSGRGGTGEEAERRTPPEG